MICAAPAARAPCTTERPMPPSPSTTTVAPGSTLAVLSTAPTPVCTAQPMTQAVSSGVSAGHLHRAGLVAHGVLGEATDAEAAVHLLAAPRQSGRAVEERAAEHRGVVDAAPGLVALAPVAATARRDRREHDLVAGRQHGDALADRVDDPGGLVAEHRRDWRRRCCAARCSRSGRCRSGARAPGPDQDRGLRCRRRRGSGRVCPIRTVPRAWVLLISGAGRRSAGRACAATPGG